MSTPKRSLAVRILTVVALASMCLALAWHLTTQPLSLAANGAPPAAPTTYPAFTNPPDILAQLSTARPAFTAPLGDNDVHPGTPGRTLPAPEPRTGATFAILSDRTAGFEWGTKYLSRAVDELNLVRPDLVLTLGDHVEGYSRSLDDYAAEALQYHQIVDRLAMPWYPTAGNHDVMPGTRDPSDHRFEALYQKYFAPLYYSVDYQDLHFIVLYSDELLQSQSMLSEAQLAWLKNDLNKTFEFRRTHGGGGHVFVLIHKPLWRYAKSNWPKVHELLVDFNRRPLVTVEGAGPPSAKAGPKVDAVFAGHVHAYTQDPVLDRIAYYTLSVTGGAIDQDRTTGQMQSYLLVKVDAGGPHLGLIEPGSIHKDDFITAPDRAVLEQIARLDERSIGVEGLLEQPVGKAVGNKDQNSHLLSLVLNNPLDVPLDVAMRMASTANLSTANQKDTANPFTNNYDSPWQLYSPYATQHLKPKEQITYSMAMFCPAQSGEVAPPQLEFVVTWRDSKGRSVPTLLKRRLPLIPSAALPIRPAAPQGADDAAWDGAVRAGTYAYIPSPYEKPEMSPDLSFLADANNVYLKVHVPDTRFSYFPNFADPANLPADAVAIAFAPTPDTPAAKVERIVILPFAPAGPQLLTNTGVATATDKQTPLLALDTKAHAVSAQVIKADGHYELIITIPRGTLLAGSPDGQSCVLNVTVTDNDDSAHSTSRSWARENLGPPAWARLKLVAPAPRTP